MSHISKINLAVKDLDALAEAAPNVGMEFRQGQKTYRTYGGARNPCQHALRLKDAVASDFEIGVLGTPEAGYELKTDTWGQDRLLAAVGGPDFGKLKQEYAVSVAQRTATAALARRGFVATRENLANGHVRLALRRR